MLLKIEIPTRFLCVPAVNAGPIVAALESAFAVESEGWGKDMKWAKSESAVTCEFVSESFMKEAPEPLKKALANYETAQSNWLGEYNKRAAAEKERDELKAKLAELQKAVTS